MNRSLEPSYPEAIAQPQGEAGMRSTANPAGLRSRQTVTILLLFAGYAAYYFCRADLSVSTPLLVEELHGRGLSSNDAVIRIGAMSSFGVLAYALGKLFLGGLGDLWGGRRSFLIGLGGAAGFTVLFAASGMVPIFTLAWIGNRLTQSIGWAGAVKVCSKWYDFSSYGTIIGILSLSYLIGDAAARQLMGMLIEHGFGWRALFYFAAGVAGCLFIANALFLRESRLDAGYQEAVVNPLNLFAEKDSRPVSLAAILKPLLLSRAFVVVCVLSLGCTVVRETFNTWTPVYLHSYVGYSTGRAASLSAIFPAVGAVSVIVTGWISDRLGANSRSLVMLVGLSATAVALSVLTAAPAGAAAAAMPLVLIGVIAFCLLGPYSYLGGAFALDFGGKQAGAASSGIIDGVGYLGGVLAGDSVARVSVAFGWHGVFVALAAISALSAAAAGYLYIHQARRLAGGKA
jgi:OPA family glycerol-3-phosphate transporter-like MFS transporter